MYITFSVCLHKVSASPMRVVGFQKYTQTAKYPMGFQFHKLSDLQVKVRPSALPVLIARIWGSQLVSVFYKREAKCLRVSNISSPRLPVSEKLTSSESNWVWYSPLL